MGLLSVEMVYFMAHEAGMEGIPVRKMICDRCGEEIDQGFENKYDLLPKAFCKIYNNDVNTMGYKVDDLEYELCENCANQLVTFLKG